MSLTKKQFEQGDLFKKFEFRKSIVHGSDVGSKKLDFYLSKELGLSIGIQALDGFAIDLFRVSGRRAWSEYPEDVSEAIQRAQYMLVCEYVLGPGAGLDEKKVDEFAEAIISQLNRECASGGITRALIGGCEICYVGQNGEIVGIEASTARGEDWDATL